MGHFSLSTFQIEYARYPSLGLRNGQRMQGGRRLDTRISSVFAKFGGEISASNDVVKRTVSY